MLMFIIYALIIYICSIGSTSFIKENSKIYKLKNIIGFCVLLSILQLLYYPFQCIKASSLIFHIITGIILIFTFILGCLNIKKKDFSFLKSYEFYIIFTLVFIIIKIIPGIEAGDDSFYMSLFIDNANIKSINTIDPRVGIVGKVDSVYFYQGYYQLMSFLYKIQSIIFNNPINDIFVSFRSTMSLVCVIFSSQIFNYLRETYLKKENKRIFYLIELLALLLVGTLEWMHIYWGSFMLLQIFIPLFMIIFNLYLKDRSYKYLLFIINLASIALASSTLFLFAIISFAFFVYELYKNKCNCEDYYLVLLPSMIYTLFLFDKLILLPIFIIGYFIVLRLNNKINDLANKFLIYILLLLPIIFFIFSILGDYRFSLESYRLGKSIFVFNLAISLYALYMLFKSKDINPVLFVFLIVFIYFFNPLVQPFVSHKFTSTYVYYRLFYITKNPFIIIVIFLELYEFIKDYKYENILKRLYFVIIIILIVNYGCHLAKNTILVDNYNIEYNYLLREDKKSIELGKKLRKLDKDSKIFSIYFAPRIYNENLITFVARYPDDYDAWYKNIIVRVLYREKDKINDLDYSCFVENVRENGYDYLITYNDSKVLKRIDNKNFKIIYKNDIFLLIKSEV